MIASDIRNFQESVVSPVQGAFVRQGTLVLVDDNVVELFNRIRGRRPDIYPDPWDESVVGSVWVQQRFPRERTFRFAHLNTTQADLEDGIGSMFVMLPNRHQNRRVLVCGKSTLRYIRQTRDQYRDPEVQDLIRRVRLLGLADLFRRHAGFWKLRDDINVPTCPHHVVARNEIEKGKYSKRNRNGVRSPRPARERDCAHHLFWSYSPTMDGCVPPPSMATVDLVGLYNTWVRDEAVAMPFVTRELTTTTSRRAHFASDRQRARWYSLVKQRVFEAGGVPDVENQKWRSFVDPETGRRTRLPDLEKGRIVRERVQKPLNNFDDLFQ